MPNSVLAANTPISLEGSLPKEYSVRAERPIAEPPNPWVVHVLGAAAERVACGAVLGAALSTLANRSSSSSSLSYPAAVACMLSYRICDNKRA